MEEFWKGEIGVDWMSISECYFPAGSSHRWQAAEWTQMTAEEFQCPDSYRRMVVTWDGRHTMPCCQGFTLEIDGGPVVKVPGYPFMKSLKEAWASPNFERLREAHRRRTWDDPEKGESICKACAVTKKTVRLDAYRERRALPVVDAG
jgi:hypothetical protein